MTYITIVNDTHTFTFPEFSVKTITPDIVTSPEFSLMPSAGPMQTINNDVNGTMKTITINGELIDSTTPNLVVSGDAHSPYTLTREQMKFWLESLQNGLQNAKLFTSNLESYSVSNTGVVYVDSNGKMSTSNTGPTAGYDADFDYTTCVPIPALFTPTKIYATKLSVTEDSNNPSALVFTLTMSVSGD